MKQEEQPCEPNAAIVASTRYTIDTLCSTCPSPNFCTEYSYVASRSVGYITTIYFVFRMMYGCCRSRRQARPQVQGGRDLYSKPLHSPPRFRFLRAVAAREGQSFSGLRCVSLWGGVRGLSLSEIHFVGKEKPRKTRRCGPTSISNNFKPANQITTEVSFSQLIAVPLSSNLWERLSTLHPLPSCTSTLLARRQCSCLNSRRSVATTKAYFCTLWSFWRYGTLYVLPSSRLYSYLTPHLIAPHVYLVT